MSGSCLSRETWVAFLEERLGEPERTAAAVHLNGCPECEARVEEIVATLSVDRPAPGSGPADEPRELRSFLQQLKQLSREPAGQGGTCALDSMAATVVQGASADTVVITTERNRQPPAETIGPYRLKEVLGQGGFGIVYKAEQVAPLRRTVALKVVKPGMGSREVIARFEAERQALAVMDHPHIAHVLDAGTTAAGQPYFVMDLVDGVPITAWCDAHRLTIRKRLELFVTVCQAVQHAHMKGIIHRDLKPSNVLVTERDGQPHAKVIDFGIAKALGQSADLSLTTAGQMIGTPLYMSPEQAGQAASVDTRSDVYSLGVILYELLTGTTPFDSERLKQTSLFEALRIIREEEPPRPSSRLTTRVDASETIATHRGVSPRELVRTVRTDLDWIVLKTLEKDRDRRYESVSALAADLQRVLNHEPVEASPPSRLYRLRRYARRNRLLLGTTTTVFVALVTGTALALWQAAIADRERGRAELREGETRRALTRVTETSKALAAETRRAVQASRDAEMSQKLAELESRKARDAFAQYLTAAGTFSDLLLEFRGFDESGRLGLLVDEKSRALYTEFIAEAEAKQSLPRERGLAHSRLARLDWGKGRLLQSRRHSDAAIALLEPVVHQDEGDRLASIALAQSHMFRCRVLMMEGERTMPLVQWAWKGGRQGHVCLTMPPRWGRSLAVDSSGTYVREIPVSEEEQTPVRRANLSVDEALGQGSALFQQASASGERARDLLMRHEANGLELVMVLRGLMALKWNMGEKEASLASARQAVAVLEKLPGHARQGTETTVVNVHAHAVLCAEQLGELAGPLSATGDARAAEACLQRAIEILRQVPDDWQYSGTVTLGPPLWKAYGTLIALLVEQGRNDEAEAIRRARFDFRERLRLRLMAIPVANVRELVTNREGLISIRSAADSLAQSYEALPELEPGTLDDSAVSIQHAIELRERFCCHPYFDQYETKDRPRLRQCYSTRGVIYAAMVRRGDGEASADAEAAFRQAIATQPGSENSYSDFRSYLLEAGRRDEAIELGLEMIRNVPNSESGRTEVAELLVHAGRVPDAIRLLTEAVEKFPKSEVIHSQLGGLLLWSGDLPQALPVLRRTLDMSPNVRNKLTYGLTLLRIQARKEQLPAEWERVLDEALATPEAHLAMAQVHWSAGAWEQAHAASREAVRLAPANIAANRTVGNVLSVLGRFDEAAEVFSRAATLAQQQGGLDSQETASVLYTPRWAVLVQQLSDLTHGDRSSITAREDLALGEFCVSQINRPVLALRLFESAVRKDSELLANPQLSVAYNTACAAARAASGQGVDATQLDDRERCRMRDLAASHLTAELANFEESAPTTGLEASRFVKELEWWLRDPDLAGVREPAVLAKFDADERSQWDSIWARTQRVLDKARAVQEALMPRFNAMWFSIGSMKIPPLIHAHMIPLLN